MKQTDRPAGPLTIRQYDGVSRISAADWDRVAGMENPFLRHAFLAGLEEHRCLEDHGWIPCPMTAGTGDRVVGAALLYLRTNSYGEFVFDWAWADAFERAGGRYYPKLVSAVPFTPVRGPRLLVDPSFPDAVRVRRELVSAILSFCEENSLSSFHCLFPAAADHEAFRQAALLPRKTCQFHWHNRDYRSFDGFLDALSSKKRKQVRRERREVGRLGLNIERLSGGDISADQWRTFYDFYRSTFMRRWGSPRLTLDFFEYLGETMPGETLLILARRNGTYVAGAFAMIGRDTLYGRHWGCAEDLPFLHFELCYYQTIEHCIEHGLGTVDAGVQGEHKLSRGFEPVGMLSWHWLHHAGFRAAVSDYLDRETPQVDAYVAALNDHLPYKTPEPS